MASKPDAWVASFEERREHLRKVAYRMLGSRAEADDALQEAWLRVNSASAGEVDNIGGWLTTVVARVCLDMLRSRRARREGGPLDASRSTTVQDLAGDPEPDLLLADSIGPALLVVLENLQPAERVAFVLHDMFDLPFEEIATILGRSADSARQLASRARRRIQGGPREPDVDLTRQRRVVDAFLAASRRGDFDALLSVLDPGVRLSADETAVQTAAASQWGGALELPREVRGDQAVAAICQGRARGVQPALIDGAPGAIWKMEGAVRSVWMFALAGDKITRIELIMNPDRLSDLDVET